MSNFRQGDTARFQESENEWAGPIDLIVKSAVSPEFDLAYIRCATPTGKDERSGHVFYHKIGLYSELLPA